MLRKAHTEYGLQILLIYPEKSLAPEYCGTAIVAWRCEWGAFLQKHSKTRRMRASASTAANIVISTEVDHI